MKKTLRQRFEEKVDRSGGSVACHEWTAGLWSDGYGEFWANGKNDSAHRLAYELSIGPIPEGLHVLHRCDNPPCVNPAHLFLGTAADNAADRDGKGRQGDYSGERHGNAKLTGDQVRIIRSLAGTKTQREIGEMFGVERSSVSLIVSRKRWKSVA